MFLNGSGSRRTFPIKGDIEIGGSSAFLLVLENLDICCSKRRILIVSFYHRDVTEGKHRKQFRYENVEGTCDM